MNKIKFLLLILIIFLLAGCGVNPYMDDPPPKGYKEVRCTYVDGDGRYGLPLTNYVKGAVKMAKLTIFGELTGVNANCNSNDDGTVSVTVHGSD